jgi:hypothetical protein
MTDLDIRHIFSAESRSRRAAAEINVLKPDGMKLLIEAPDLLPNVAAKHQKRAGRLLHWTGLIDRTIKITIFAIDGIGGPQAVEAEKLENEHRRGRKPPNGETGLRAASIRSSTGVSKFTSGFSRRMKSASVARTP